MTRPACGRCACVRPRAAGAGAGAGAAAAVALAGAGAAGYGVTVVIGRSLARDGLAPATALGIRFAIAAAVLGALLAIRGARPRVEPQPARPHGARGDRLRRPVDALLPQPPARHGGDEHPAVLRLPDARLRDRLARAARGPPVRRHRRRARAVGRRQRARRGGRRGGDRDRPARRGLRARLGARVRALRDRRAAAGARRRRDGQGGRRRGGRGDHLARAGRAHRTGSSRPAGAGCCSSPTACSRPRRSR